MNKRLEIIHTWIDPEESVLDVGTDHGLLPLSLVERGHKGKIFASEVSQGPFEIARNSLKTRNVTLLFGSGLAPLEECVDVAIFAGMGGELIARLLQEEEEKARSIKKLIFQPMQQIHVLREYLYSHQYKVIGEEVYREDHRFYHYILAKSGQDKIYDFDLGKGISSRRTDYYHYLENMIQSNVELLEKIPLSYREKREEILKQNERIQTKLSNRM